MSKNFTRRAAVTSLAAGAAAAALPPAARAQSTELTFWTWRQEDRAQYGELFADFYKKTPGITIKYEAFEPQNYGTALSTALAAGKGPDVIHIRAYGGTEQFAKAGYLVPLTMSGAKSLP